MKMYGTLLLATALSCSSCAVIGTRVVRTDVYFAGVRGDARVIAEYDTTVPAQRVHPVLPILEMPFSVVGDILFLPYDFWFDIQTKGRMEFD